MYEMKFQRKNLHRHEVVHGMLCFVRLLSVMLLSSSCRHALESGLICVEPSVGQAVDDGIAVQLIFTPPHSRTSAISAALRSSIIFFNSYYKHLIIYPSSPWYIYEVITLLSSRFVSLFSFCFDRVDGRCVSEWLEDNFIGSLGWIVGLDLPYVGRS